MAARNWPDAGASCRGLGDLQAEVDLLPRRREANPAIDLVGLSRLAGSAPQRACVAYAYTLAKRVCSVARVTEFGQGSATVIPRSVRFGGQHTHWVELVRYFTCRNSYGPVRFSSRFGEQARTTSKRGKALTFLRGGQKEI